MLSDNVPVNFKVPALIVVSPEYVLEPDKVKGTENPADMNTKGLKAEDIIRYTEMLDMEHRQGRAELAPEVNQMINKNRCIRFNSSPVKVTKKLKEKI